MKLSIIAAVANNGVIGNKGKIPWNLPDDLKRFRRITYGSPIIMGRKTFESIGKPLNSRVNIIVTRNRDYKQDGCIVVHSLDDAILACNDCFEAFVIGGESLYTEALDIADRIYLTHVHKEFDGDTYFPEYMNKFGLYQADILRYAKNDEFQYIYAKYDRINNN